MGIIMGLLILALILQVFASKVLYANPENHIASESTSLTTVIRYVYYRDPTTGITYRRAVYSYYGGSVRYSSVGIGVCIFIVVIVIVLSCACGGGGGAVVVDSGPVVYDTGYGGYGGDVVVVDDGFGGGYGG